MPISQGCFCTRVGRLTSSPAQFGHTPLRSFVLQWLQKVHSNEQIIASCEPLGKSRPQRSHFSLISNIVASLRAKRLGRRELKMTTRCFCHRSQRKSVSEVRPNLRQAPGRRLLPLVRHRLCWRQVRPVQPAAAGLRRGRR